MLAEAYFGQSKAVFVIAIISGLYFMLFTGQVSHSYSRHNRQVSQSDQVDSLNIKDALANAGCVLWDLL